MNNREFRKHLQAVAHGEKPLEEKESAPKLPLPERAQLPQKEAAAKRPPVKSKQSTLRTAGGE
jgi:hypothetical protein